MTIMYLATGEPRFLNAEVVEDKDLHEIRELFPEYIIENLADDASEEWTDFIAESISEAIEMHYPDKVHRLREILDKYEEE